MSISVEEVGKQTSAYLSEQWDEPVELLGIEKIFGGASRETYRLKLKVSGNERGVVVRRDPPTSLIDTERALEYGAYKAIFPTSVPVPEPLFLEDDEKWLGQPFSVMSEVKDSVTDTQNLTEAQRKKIGEQKWKILGELAAMDPEALGFAELTDMPSPAECAIGQLDYWEGVILKDQLHPQPIAMAAIRWLRNNMPPPAQKLSVVHGDFRSGNFLFQPDGDITAILDWEMCHVGDPLEDLGWSFDPLWSQTPELAGNLLPRSEALAIWETASGLKVDRDAFVWWRVFNAVKAVAIWISSSEDFHRGESKDSILAFAGWVMTDRQNRILIDYLDPNSAHEYGALKL